MHRNIVMFLKRRWKLLVLLLLLFTAISIFLSNYWIIHSTQNRIYSSVNDIPERKVGLLLGTSKLNHGGFPNLFFKYRIEAAAELFKAGKIRHILVSGDNSIKEYDEANDMREALVEQGVPDSCITLDFAGFRTLDSVVRCLKIFEQSDITIISQEFHDQRALFIADHYGMNAVAFATKDVPAKYSLKTSVREYFAKFKAVLDLYLLQKQPKFLGKSEPIRL